MKSFLLRHRETILVFLLGLVIFAGLNWLMLQMNYEMWTNAKLGPYSAFHRGWELSGFDNTTYIAVATWRPLYIMMRHPLIMYFVWPMYELNDILQDQYHMNCSILIVAAVWTLISTFAWTFLYRILRKIIELPIAVSLLLCLFYFSFSHVMLATCAPDHMILSMTILLFTLYISAKATKSGKQLSTWKSLILCFISTGISTTNCAKIWLIDTCSMQSRLEDLKTLKWWRHFILHGMLYFIPLACVGGLYYYQQTTIFAEEEQYSNHMSEDLKKKRPEKYAEIVAKSKKADAENEAKQMGDGQLFQWTDFSLPLMPSIVENMFGEGFQLHDKYTLRDSHRHGHRPDIVNYSHWYNYLVEAIIVLLLIAGVWFGRKERLMWMALAVFGFDCLLHLGFRFALNDVYIMTAHWAFIIPFAIGYLYKNVSGNVALRNSLLAVVALVAIWLWYHNLSLTYDFIINGYRV